MIGRLHCGGYGHPDGAPADADVARPMIGRLHCGAYCGIQVTAQMQVARPMIGRLHCGEPEHPDHDIARLWSPGR